MGRRSNPELEAAPGNVLYWFAMHGKPIHRPPLRLCAAAALLLFFSPDPVRGGDRPLAITFPDFARLKTVDVHRLRLSGRVSDPASGRVTVNGQPVRVYPTGAFVGLVELVPGGNEIAVESQAGGLVERRVFHVVREQPPASLPQTPLVFEKWMDPSCDLTVSPGDEIEVAVKGSAGCKARVRWGWAGAWRDLGEAFRADGVRGVYTGLVRVPDGRAGVLKLTAELSDGGGQSVRRSLDRKVTVLDPRQAPVCQTRDETRVRNSFGGTFLTVLPDGIRMPVAGLRAGMCQVRLSAEQTGWVSKSEVQVLPAGTPTPPAMIREIRREPGGNGRERFVLPMDCRVPFEAHCTPACDTVEIRLYRCFSKLNWIDAPYDSSLVRHVSWRQAGEVCTVQFSLVPGRMRGYQVEYEAGQLAVTFCPVRAQGPRRVVIDPGHGGEDPGAVGPAGTHEKDQTLAVALRLSEVLRDRGVSVTLTRSADATTPLRDRVLAAEQADADLFVSVHLNAVPMSSDPLESSGFHVFYTQPFSYECARAVHAACRKLPYRDGGLVNADYYVTRQTTLPAVLVECLFITHPEDEGLLLLGDARERLARALADGVEAALAGAAPKS